jgi:DNA-damage-inducible protein J
MRARLYIGKRWKPVRVIVWHGRMEVLTMASTILNQTFAGNDLPFEEKEVSANPYAALSESEVLEKLEKSREQASNGMPKEASEASRGIRDRYGL